MSCFPDTSFLCSVYRTQIHSPQADAYMAKRKGRSNAHSLFMVRSIPSDAQTRNMLDELEESYFAGDYEWLHEQVRASGRMDGFRDIG